MYHSTYTDTDSTTPGPGTADAEVLLTPGLVDRMFAAFLGCRHPATARAYGADLLAFAHCFGRPSAGDALYDFLCQGPYGAQRIIDIYIDHLRATGVSASLANRRISALRSFLDHARIMQVIPWCVRLPAFPEAAVWDVAGPGHARSRVLLDTARRYENPHKACRDALLILLVSGMGLRPCEILSLEPIHVDVEHGILSILGRGRHYRSLLRMPEDILPAMHAWLVMRSPTSPWLFHRLDCPADQRPLTDRGLRLIARRHGQRHRIRTNPRGLRRSAITRAVELQMPSRDIHGLARVRFLECLRSDHQMATSTGLHAMEVLTQELMAPQPQA